MNTLRFGIKTTICLVSVSARVVLQKVYILVFTPLAASCIDRLCGHSNCFIRKREGWEGERGRGGGGGGEGERERGVEERDAWWEGQ